MVSNITKAICYGVVAVLSALCLIYQFMRIFGDGTWVGYMIDPSVFFNIATLIYAAFMVFLCISNPGGSPLLSEGLVSSSNTNFMKDVYFKFLFSIGFAIGLAYCLLLISSKFGVLETTGQWVTFYISFILPILLIIDLKFFDHHRCPDFTKDIIIIGVILLCHAIYYVLCWIFQLGFSNGIKFWSIALAGDLAVFIYAFNGYLFYDYTLYRKSSQGNYVLFK